MIESDDSKMQSFVPTLPRGNAYLGYHPFFGVGNLIDEVLVQLIWFSSALLFAFTATDFILLAQEGTSANAWASQIEMKNTWI